MKPVYFCVALFFGLVPAFAEDEATPLPAPNWALKKERLQQLPNGNHVASVMEFMYQPAVLVNPDTGGFSRGEDARLSMLGESTRWQRWFFGGANITNPSRPGEPLYYVPVGILGQISAEKYVTGQTEKNGIHMEPLRAEAAASYGQLSLPVQVNGPEFIPRRVADREPASDWGAPATSRGYAAGSFEGESLFQFRKDGKPAGFLFADGFLSRRAFNSLSSYETSGEASVISGFAPEWLKGDSLHLALQARSRSNLGAEYFLTEAQTLKSDQYSALGHYNFSNENAEGTFAFGYAYRKTTLNASGMNRSVTDALIQPPVMMPENTHSGFVDASGSKKNSGEWFKWAYGINSRFEFFGRRESPAANLVTENLYGTVFGATLYQSPSIETNYLMRWQPFLKAEKKDARYEIHGGANAHVDWGFTDEGSKIGFIHPAANLKAQAFLGNTAFFAGGGLLHDTLGFTLQEISFLNKDSLSGTRYNWNDSNANATPDTGEVSAATRTGGKYHSVARGLQAPQKEELNFNFGYAGFRNWLMKINFNGRIYRKLFEVRYADGTSPGFTPNTAGLTVPVYDRTSSGNEIYELRNAEKDAYYAQAEISLAQTDLQNPWIFQGSIGGYYSAGYAPQGLNAFYNDPGQYNETTADPNFRENRFGRADNDRGYIGKIIFGRRFFNALTVSNVIRYRDGEPVAGYKVVTGLAQGPIAVPVEERGGGLSGIGRHTYSLAWDLRVRYEGMFSGNKAWAFIDIYNLMNSRTELAEYPLQGTAFRDPVEQGIARTMRLGVGMSF